MSGLEIPSFIIGLGGLVAVFEKGFEVWRTIREANDFGHDVADWMCKLEMEFFRFQTWWTALEHLALRPGHPQSVRRVPSQTSALQVTLDKQFGQPITDAAVNILKLLEKIEEVLKRNGILTIFQAQPPEPRQTLDLSEETSKSRTRLKKFADDLLKHTPWITRIKHNASPWKDNDKSTLDSLLESMIYWNNALYSILPQNLRDSILELGIAGYALDTSDNIGDISRLSSNRNTVLSQSAKFIRLRQRFKDGAATDADLDVILHKMERKMNHFDGIDAAKVLSGCQYSIAHYSPDEVQPRRVMIEWIPFPQGDYDVYKLARTRMSQISYSLQQIGELSHLQVLPSLGFIEYGSAKVFGLVSALPTSVTSTTTIVTLYDILPGSQRPGVNERTSSRRSVNYPLPSLNQRFELASTLVMGFYTFLLTRWHHERFSSLHIAFLLNEVTETTNSSSTDVRPFDLGAPIIGGFAISRPDSPTELSISAPVEDFEAVYLHPDVRQRLKSRSTAPNTNPESQTRYQRVHDIYALGLLLVEIGFWRPLARVAESGSGGKVKAGSLSAKEFKEAIVKKCRSDLAFWMGETYKEVTLRCLLAGEEGGVQAADGSGGLNNFYWDVGISLMNSENYAGQA
ncbi:hypothetical protein CEP51_001680 [Fusarium floridanum]|uniref:Prion-inhibition and propagation HeLo domain-containing protein n=1 Tax=Fusarium floridanum TaxID=1325733 RepID=A0A428SFJ0_9HYPO|nr:hypothetical protein CEP51_001680 [Fusarium floridanum]